MNEVHIVKSLSELEELKKQPWVKRLNKRPTLSEKLAKKIERDIGIICDPETFRRTYAGYWQKSLGAFVWAMRIKGSPKELGSGYPASECVKSKYKLTLSCDGLEIYPELADPEEKKENRE